MQQTLLKHSYSSSRALLRSQQPRGDRTSVSASSRVIHSSTPASLCRQHPTPLASAPSPLPQHSSSSRFVASLASPTSSPSSPIVTNKPTSAAMSSSPSSTGSTIRTMDLSGFLQRVAENNSGLEELPTLTPWLVGGKLLGRIKPGFAEQLRRFPTAFVVSERLGPEGNVRLSPDLEAAAPEARTKAVAAVLDTLRQEGTITGWRDELYPVLASFYEAPALLLERAAATHFGIKAYGVHVNGWVDGGAEGPKLWVARRSRTKATWPNMLDHIVAGGQPHGMSPTANVIKECGEEAGIPPELAAQARPVGSVSYLTISKAGYKPDVLFCYDLQLPPHFVPKPQDGEVEEFMLWPLAKVAEVVGGSQEFKTNCNLVIIDFLIRHGFIGPEQAGYLELVRALRQGELC